MSNDFSDVPNQLLVLLISGDDIQSQIARKFLKELLDEGKRKGTTRALTMRSIHIIAGVCEEADLLLRALRLGGRRAALGEFGYKSGLEWFMRNRDQLKYLPEREMRDPSLYRNLRQKTEPKDLKLRLCKAALKAEGFDFTDKLIGEAIRLFT